MKTVSIIVPYYNTEEHYIKQCLDSIFHSEYKNVEVIIIDDGSDLKYVEMINDVVKNYNRIILLRQENSGPSVARNLGIEKATGEYLMFLDSDDFISKDYISSMVSVIEKYKADMVCSSVVFVDENGNNIEGKSCYNKKEQCIDTRLCTASEIYSCLLVEEKEYWIPVCIAGKMYNRKLIDHVRFDKELVNGEDQIFTIDCIKNLSRIAFTNEGCYLYRQLATSLQHSYNYKCAERYKKFFLALIDRMDGFDDLLSKKLLQDTRLVIELVYCKKNYRAFKIALEELYSEKNINKFYKKISIRKSNDLKTKIMAFLIKRKCILGIYFLKSFN